MFEFEFVLLILWLLLLLLLLAVLVVLNFSKLDENSIFRPNEPLSGLLVFSGVCERDEVTIKGKKKIRLYTQIRKNNIIVTHQFCLRGG
jgi:hypothetical protein